MGETSTVSSRARRSNNLPPQPNAHVAAHLDRRRPCLVLGRNCQEQKQVVDGVFQRR